MIRKRVVIAGLGDSGVLAAIGLSRHFDVVGISVKPALVSGQELGWRLSRPDDWARAYWIPFDRFRALDRVRTVHGTLTGVDLAARNVFVRHEDGSTSAEEYDALVISTGVTNGFWRQPSLQSADDIGADLRTAHDRLSAALSVIVVGGGAAAVSSAASVARTWPDKRVGLYFPRERALVHHHPRTWERVLRRLGEAGVALHPGHRASIPDGFACDQITSGRVQWSTGQPPAFADAVLWTTGRVRPNTGWLPPGMLDEHGFVRVTAGLQVPGHPNVFAVGDVAATDPLRSSARNRGDRILAHNVRAEFDGRPLRSYRPPKGRWGSVIGPQSDGLEAFAANGLAFRFPAWSFDRVLIPWIVKRGIYKGVRDEPPGGGAAISEHQLTPHFEDVQAHYDLSDEFFRLFLDPTQTYSCAYFARDDMTLEEAQIAKIDLALGKLGLQPGMTLLDVGCGWGATMRRAIKNYDVNVVGLTLSKNQATHVQQAFDQMDSPRTKRVLLAGWEQFDEPVDRIVSIAAFEHFGRERYPAFFKMAYQALPADGVMLLHTIVGRHPKDAQRLGVPLTFELARFIKFVMTEIFPGGRLPSTPMVEGRATEAGFAVTRIQSLQPHYAKTLDTWAAALHANKDKAIAIQSQEVYDRYMKYLTGCAKLFRQGQVDVDQFTLEKRRR